MQEVGAAGVAESTDLLSGYPLSGNLTLTVGYVPDGSVSISGPSRTAQPSRRSISVVRRVGEGPQELMLSSVT